MRRHKLLFKNSQSFLKVATSRWIIPSISRLGAGPSIVRLREFGLILNALDRLEGEFETTVAGEPHLSTAVAVEKVPGH
ncbi:MAG: hypothetical protein WB630_03185 [Candidatus Acidiferrales bacterium]